MKSIETTLEYLDDEISKLFEEDMLDSCSVALEDDLIVVDEALKVQIPEYGIECLQGYLIDEDGEIQTSLTVVYKTGDSINNFDYYESDGIWVTLYNYMRMKNKELNSNTKCVLYINEEDSE